MIHNRNDLRVGALTLFFLLCLAIVATPLVIAFNIKIVDESRKMRPFCLAEPESDGGVRLVWQDERDAWFELLAGSGPAAELEVRWSKRGMPAFLPVFVVHSLEIHPLAYRQGDVIDKFFASEDVAEQARRDILEHDVTHRRLGLLAEDLELRLESPSASGTWSIHNRNLFSTAAGIAVLIALVFACRKVLCLIRPKSDECACDNCGYPIEHGTAIKCCPECGTAYESGSRAEAQRRG